MSKTGRPTLMRITDPTFISKTDSVLMSITDPTLIGCGEDESYYSGRGGGDTIFRKI